MLLRDFAINFGVVAESAKKLAEEIFHFEKRIVNKIANVKNSTIMTLGELQKIVPMV